MNAPQATTGPSALERQRADNALEFVRQMKTTFASQDSKLRRCSTLARDVPLRLLLNGTGPAVAFLLAKAEGKAGSPEGLLVLALSRWLLDERRLFGTVPAGNGLDRLMDAIISAQPYDYERSQHEAVVWAGWLKRFAEAFLPQEKPDSHEAQAQVS